MAAPNEVIFALRQAVKEGAVAGPRIIASGNCLTITGGHGSEYGSPMYWEVDSAQEFLNAVRKQWRAGADFIKIIETESTLYPVVPGRVYFSADEMRAGVEEAHGFGLKVAAHANTHPDGLRSAVEVGVDTLEHGYPADDVLLDAMAEKGIILIPTLSVYYQIADAAKRGDLMLPPPVLERIGRVCEQVSDTARRAIARGVRMALGTDAGNPNTWHGDSGLELHYLQDAGMTPMQAIMAGTRTSAEACGWEDRIGTIAPGKLADCILVEGDPLASLDILRGAKQVQMVMQAGRVVVDRGSVPVTEEAAQ